MAEVIAIGAPEDLVTKLQPYFQSGNLNFLLGSGASMPAIKIAGDTEGQINDLLAKKKDDEADLLSLGFIEEIEAVSDNISWCTLVDDTNDIALVLKSYTVLLAAIDKILFERKNSLLPRQANIFTTNYDSFVENAAADVPGLMLNDGFDRTSGITGSFKFAPELFSDRTFRASSVFSRQSEVPTINLFKLHGSVTWSRVGNEIFHTSKMPKKLAEDKKKEPDSVGKARRCPLDLIQFKVRSGPRRGPEHEAQSI